MRLDHLLSTENIQATVSVAVVWPSGPGRFPGVPCGRAGVEEIGGLACPSLRMGGSGMGMLLGSRTAMAPVRGLAFRFPWPMAWRPLAGVGRVAGVWWWFENWIVDASEPPRRGSLRGRVVVVSLLISIELQSSFIV